MIIGFLSISNYTLEARDIVRISDLELIKKSLDFYKMRETDFPEPDNKEGNKIFGESSFLKVKILNKLPKDPLTGKEYIYEKIGNGYILEATLESGEEKILFGGDLPKNCSEYLKLDNSLKSGEYKIFPNNKKIVVFCDMETKDSKGESGWTRYVNIKGNYSFESAKNCWLGNIISNDKIDCFNPNRFNMIAERFMLKVNGINYFYNNPNPEPDNNNFSYKDIRSCLGGKSYMTIMTNKKINKFDLLEEHDKKGGYIRLGLSFCHIPFQFGGFWGNGASENGYLNYSSREVFGPKGEHSWGDSRKNYPSISEIYIK